MLRLVYSNTISSHTEANERAVSAEIKNDHAAQLNEIATVRLFEVNGEESEHTLSLNLVKGF